MSVRATPPRRLGSLPAEHKPAGETERKYLLDRAEVAELQPVVTAHLQPVIYHRRQPLAFTRTTYLDTVERALYRNLSGTGDARLRIREYAAACEGQPARLTGDRYLECKLVHGVQRSKVRVRIPSDAMTGHAHHPLARDWLAHIATTNGFAALASLLCHAIPQVSTWYRRSSYTTPDNTVRLTLDERVAFTRPSAGGRRGDRAWPGQMLCPGPDYLLELKGSPRWPTALAQAIARLGTASSYSKFHAGMAAVAAAHRYPRHLVHRPR